MIHIRDLALIYIFSPRRNCALIYINTTIASPPRAAIAFFSPGRNCALIYIITTIASPPRATIAFLVPDAIALLYI